MGTNFYLSLDECEHCSRCNDSERIHIGKRSGGWQFSLHAPDSWNVPDEFKEAIAFAPCFEFEPSPRERAPVASWKTWKQLLEWAFSRKGKRAVIRDEYGDKMPLEEFVAMVEGLQAMEGLENHALYVQRGRRAICAGWMTRGIVWMPIIFLRKKFKNYVWNYLFASSGKRISAYPQSLCGKAYGIWFSLAS